jgi:diguanylate cyclase (GGDEF)-like protein
MRVFGRLHRRWTALPSSGWSAGIVGLASSFVLAEIFVARWQGGVKPPPLVDMLFFFYGLVSVAGALRAGWHRHLDRRTRLAWRIVAMSYVLLSVSQALRPVFSAAKYFPTPADLLRLMCVPVLLCGLLTMPLRHHGSRERLKLIFDTTTVVVGSAMLLWYLQIGPSVAAAGRIPGPVLIASIAYPGLDLVLICGACLVLFRGAVRSSHRSLVVLAAAMFTMVIGDAYLGYRQSRGVTGYDHWQLGCWLAGAFLLAVAPLVQCQQARMGELVALKRATLAASTAPYIAVGAGYLLLLALARGQQIRVAGVIVGAVVLTAVVVGRQIVALRENHRLATTDPLTGLANRREFNDRLRLALARSSRSGQTVAVFHIDMNGFKEVNDTMGHEAGDQLLVALARVLQRNVLGMDVVARLGGDEFAIIVHNIGSADNAVAVVKRIMAEMAVPVTVNDVPMPLSASIGIALSVSGDLNAEQVLHYADVAMYTAKRAKTTGYELHVQPEPRSLQPDPLSRSA